MIVSNAALHSVLHVITCKLQECAADGDDELTMRCIELVNQAEATGKDVATTPAERAAVLMAREYAGVFGAILDRMLNHHEAEYTDENDRDIEYVHDLLMDYGTGFGNADAGEPDDAHNRLEDALRCSIDAKALRLWLENNPQEG